MKKEEKFIADVNSMSEKELEETKEKTIETISKVVNGNDPFIFIGSVGEQDLITMFGTIPNIAQLVATSMAKVDHIQKIIKMATEAYEFAEKEMGKFDFLNELRKKMNNHDHFDCDTCDEEDECEIKEAKKKLRSSDDPAKLVFDLIDKITKDYKNRKSFKSKGDC